MNLKLTLLALAAVIGLGAMTVGVQAAAVYGTTPPCSGDCGGDGGTNQPGEPFDPFCHINCEEDGTTPDPEEPCVSDCEPDGSTIPEPDPCVSDCAPGDGTVPDPEVPGNQAGLKLCDAKIGDLKEVTERQISSVGGNDAVQVIPVCVDKNLIDQQDGVGNLRSAIARNKSMGQALGQDGYAPDDVVGVIVGRTQAVLYVHAL